VDEATGLQAKQEAAVIAGEAELSKAKRKAAVIASGAKQSRKEGW